MKKTELQLKVKENFFKLYRQGKMTKDLAEEMVKKAEKMEIMELEMWLRDTERELNKKVVKIEEE